MSDSEDFDDEYILPEILYKNTGSATKDETYVHQRKSQHKYQKSFDDFINWQKKKNNHSFDESNLFAYFKEIAPTSNSSSLWAKFSMLKATIKSERNVDIDQYNKLKGFIKERHKGYQAKKARVFTSSDVYRFLSEAPDKFFLPEKVALILGITGACRREELHGLKIDNLRFENSIIIVSIPNIKSNASRTFIIEGEYFQIVDKYVKMRPPYGPQNLFLSLHNDRCSNHPIGINKIGNMPKVIAAFLDLPNSEEYTGHTFRRTSKTLLANIGVCTGMLARPLEWQSTSKPSSEESVNNKRKSSNQTNSINKNQDDCEEFSPFKHVKIEVDVLPENMLPESNTEGASTAEAQTRVAVEIAEQFLTLSNKTDEFPVTGIVNAPSLVAANNPTNAPWVDLARKLGLIASKLIGPNNNNISIDFCVCGEDKKFVKTAILLGLLSGRLEGELNLISAENFADELNVKINKKSYDNCENAIFIKAGAHEIKGTLIGNTSVLSSINNVQFTDCVRLQENISIYQTKTPEDLTKIVSGHIAKSVAINNLSISGNWVIVQTNNPLTVPIDNVKSY